jgi:hypothetical protein
MAPPDALPTTNEKIDCRRWMTGSEFLALAVSDCFRRN